MDAVAVGVGDGVGVGLAVGEALGVGVGVAVSVGVGVGVAVGEAVSVAVVTDVSEESVTGTAGLAANAMPAEMASAMIAIPKLWTRFIGLHSCCCGDRRQERVPWGGR